MFTIRKATSKDVKKLTEVGKKAFYLPHKDAIPKHIMDVYLKENFNEENILKEINNKNFEYRLLYVDDTLAGFSKIILNQKNENINLENVTKMERLYLVEDFFGKGLGKELFKYNLDFIQKENQKGIWLYVWIKNFRAIDFYKKVGFKKIASYDFPISATETRPNYLLFLEF
ncbi:GNAT family N-acetyltransferase [Polaribacter sp. KT 15]|uniref:GNAT family N-acetyltransferase n=1 Tax=Polaribacter sp. KT 15 TaxID=1896175 RepID=UPI00090A965C|nr:GNAT family N-acetyltransferase [Polaribacter sp. KT 15]SHM75601.1 Ribosomal protein S18 acetylase RimI [Polaribacter sp. KT 15]